MQKITIWICRALLPSNGHSSWSPIRRHANGRVVWVSVKMAPILVDGKLQGYVANVDDISAQRSAEKALAESEQHLRTIADTFQH